MKTNYLKKVTVLLFLLSFKMLMSQIEIKGKITDKNNNPLEKILVRVQDTTTTFSDSNGFFRFNNVNLEDHILVFIDKERRPIKIALNNSQKMTNTYDNIVIEIELKSAIQNFENNQVKREKSLGGGSISMRNYWIGAKIGYNFIGATDDNFFVGSASIAMNLINDFGEDSKHSFGVIGNIGRFKFEKEAEYSKDIKKITQSINGLSVGLGYNYELPFKIKASIQDDKNKSQDKNSQENENNRIVLDNLFFRVFGHTGVRLTTYDNIDNVKDKSLNLAQSASTFGIELEKRGFIKKGALTLSAGISLYMFDKNIYNKIFEEERSSLWAYDASIVLPVSQNIGFYINGTFAKKTSATYIIGLIFRPDSK